MSTRPETVYDRTLSRAKRQFEANTAEHKMTVLLDTLDDGTPYRHLRFARPGTGMWSFNLVTWPGYLSITGDIGGQTFSRLHDMADFFRGRGSINPSYWGEKLVAEGRGTDHGLGQFSEEVFKEIVRDKLDDYEGELSDAESASLRAAADEDLMGAYGRESAIHALGEFNWSNADNSVSVSFSDAWEYDFGGYDHHFLLACHAVQYGINTYLAAHPGRYIPECSSTPLHLAASAVVS